MKKILTIVTLMLITLTIGAQKEYKGTIRAGFGASSVVGPDADYRMKFSYKVGASYDLKVVENFFVVPGLDFIVKGFHSEMGALTGTVNMAYLQMPVLAAYKINLNENTKLAISAGPYLACGLFGTKFRVNSTNHYFRVFDRPDGFRRFDVGILTGFSFEFNNLVLGFEYSRGFYKLAPEDRRYNQAFGAILGYRF